MWREFDDEIRYGYLLDIPLVNKTYSFEGGVEIEVGTSHMEIRNIRDGGIGVILSNFESDLPVEVLRSTRRPLALGAYLAMLLPKKDFACLENSELFLKEFNKGSFPSLTACFYIGNEYKAYTTLKKCIQHDMCSDRESVEMIHAEAFHRGTVTLRGDSIHYIGKHKTAVVMDDGSYVLTIDREKSLHEMGIVGLFSLMFEAYTGLHGDFENLNCMDGCVVEESLLMTNKRNRYQLYYTRDNKKYEYGDALLDLLSVKKCDGLRLSMTKEMFLTGISAYRRACERLRLFDIDIQTDVHTMRLFPDESTDLEISVTGEGCKGKPFVISVEDLTDLYETVRARFATDSEDLQENIERVHESRYVTEEDVDYNCFEDSFSANGHYFLLHLNPFYVVICNAANDSDSEHKILTEVEYKLAYTMAKYYILRDMRGELD